MTPTRRAALAAAEALGGILLWTVGSALGWHFAAPNGWALNAILIVGCCTLQCLGLTLFTNARVRHAKRMGYSDGEAAAYKKADEMMREFLTERAVFVVGQLPPRPAKSVEKAN